MTYVFQPSAFQPSAFQLEAEITDIQLISMEITNTLIQYLSSLTQQINYTLEIYKINGLNSNYPLLVTQNLRKVDEINQEIKQNLITKHTKMMRI